VYVLLKETQENKMIVLWIIAGFFIGWIGIEFAFGIFKVPIPITFNIVVGLIGALIAYTMIAYKVAFG